MPRTSIIFLYCRKMHLYWALCSMLSFESLVFLKEDSGWDYSTCFWLSFVRARTLFEDVSGSKAVVLATSVTWLRKTTVFNAQWQIWGICWHGLFFLCSFSKYIAPTLVKLASDQQERGRTVEEERRDINEEIITPYICLGFLSVMWWENKRFHWTVLTVTDTHFNRLQIYGWTSLAAHFQKASFTCLICTCLF